MFICFIMFHSNFYFIHVIVYRQTYILEWLSIHLSNNVVYVNASQFLKSFKVRFYKKDL